MRILFLTFYYPPDLCAGSFRAHSLVEELKKIMDPGDRIDVITTLPNRYSTYSVDTSRLQVDDMVRIKRVPVVSHKSRMVDQSVAFFQFFLKAISEARKNRYDLIFATSSRLMTGFLGAVLSKSKSTPLCLDVRDIFTDTLQDVLPVWLRLTALPVFRVIEKFTFRAANRINLVSDGFEPYFRKMLGDREFLHFTNGVDDEFLQADFFKKDRGSTPLILYAGNIGEGQGLHRVIPKAASVLKNEYRFVVIGDGGMRGALREELCRLGVDNVELIDPVPRARLMRYYAEADYLFLHLNDYDAFRKVLPSKIFEYAATGKPIVAGVSGYAAEFIRTNIEGACVFEPCDVEGFCQALKNLPGRVFGRDDFVEKYRRTSIMKAFAAEICLAGKDGGRTGAR